MQRKLSGNSQIVEEIVRNILSPILGEDLMVVEGVDETTQEKVTACTWETDDLHELHVRMIETMLYHREQAGLLKGLTFDVCNEEILQGSFHVVTDEPGKANSIVDDVFKTAGISESKIFCAKQPIAQDMLNFCCYAVLAVALTPEEEKAINTSFNVKKMGAKVSKTVRTVGTAAHGSTKIIMKDIVTPTAEIAGKLGGTIAAGTVNAGAKGAITFADEFTATVSIKEIKEYEPTQRLVNRVKSFWNRNKDQNAQTGSNVSKRF